MGRPTVASIALTGGKRQKLRLFFLFIAQLPTLFRQGISQPELEG